MNNFDIGNTFRNIIYFLIGLIIILIGVIIFYAIKNNELAKEMSEYTCETDIMEQGQMMDNAIFVRSFLDNKFKKIPYIETYIGEFAENHPIGKYLITTNGHITACIDGYIIDTWDCTNKEIEYIWKIV